MQLTEKAFAVVRQLEQELAAERARGQQLVDDFQYNLQLLAERDALLDRLEGELETAKEAAGAAQKRADEAEERLGGAERRLLHTEAIQAENRSLREDLTRARREVAELAQRLSEAQTSASEASTQLREVTVEHQGRLIALERYEMQHGLLQEQAETARRGEKQAREELEEMRQKLVRVEENWKSAQSRVTQLEERASQAKSEAAETQSELKAAKQMLDETSARLRRELGEKDEDLQRAVGKYKHDTRQLQEERAATESRLSALRKKTKELEANLDEVTRERDTLKQALTAEKLRTTAANDAESALRRRGLEQETALKALREELSTKVVEVQNGEVALNKLRTALVLEQREVQRLRERLVEAEAEAGTKTGAEPKAGAAAAARYRAVVGEMREEMERVAEVMRALELERNGYKARLDTVALELQELREEHARSLERAEQASGVSAQLQDARRRLSTLEGENGELRARLSLLTSGDEVEPETAILLRKLQASLREAIARLKELQTENEHLTLNNRILRERLDALTGLPPSSTRSGVAGATGATGGNRMNVSAPLATPAAPGAPAAPISSSMAAASEVSFSLNLSDLPSGLSSLGDVSDLKEKMQAALDNAGLLGL
ncbi:Coiled-coil protein [Giardia muris]|uniref:Coiled-coil protein n=1 Tax=Giardia muris TaxID=5742 RepID=A0A4Z1SP51_GIAMU|nr:Coiled-coil protein [Giardia muris]|eukprot:TNJ27604.1 Coiled-coil protein [Giardia muris]